jgi:CelD/BcsL family acetyltransferase involved in cellulose biosynthesis
VLLLRLIEAAAGAGIRTIDVATGDERFKGAFTNATVELFRGWVGQASLGALARRLRRAPVNAPHRYSSRTRFCAASHGTHCAAMARSGRAC